MRLVATLTQRIQVGAGRPTAHLPGLFIYVSDRDRDWIRRGKGRARQQLEEMKAAHPGVPLVVEGADGRLEVTEGL